MGKRSTKKEEPKTTPETTKEELKVSLEQVVSVANDFNFFMFTDPKDAINTDLELDDLIKEITEGAALLESNDTVKASTDATLKALGIEHPAKVSADVKPDSKKESASNNTLDAKNIDEILAIAKENKIPVPPTFRKDIDKLRGYVIGKLSGAPSAAPAGDTKKAEKAQKPPKEKKEKTPSAYGTGIEIMCSNPDIAREAYITAMKEAGFTLETSAGAINTAYSSVRAIVGKLRQNKHMK